MAAVRHAEKRRTSTCLFADRVAALSVEHYRKHVPSNFQETQKQTCLATIVAAYDEDEVQRLDVIAMGVGTKFLSETVLQSPQERYGERLRDCHAEVLARRALRRYLSEEIWRDEVEGREPSILQQCKEKSSLYYKLRTNVTLHFYCSSAPCGNATLKKFSSFKKEVLRHDLSETSWPSEKHEFMPGHSIPLGQFALLTKKDNTQNESVETELTPAAIMRAGIAKKESTWPANRSTDWCPPGTTTVWSNHGSLHTCSDKLCRWNCLGLQGSLLAHWMEPLYIATLTVGRKLSAVACRRAVCCRVGKSEDTKCGKAYRLHHPAIMGTAIYMDESGVIEMDAKKSEGQDVRFHSSDSWAWWPGLEKAECIDGATGYQIIEGNEKNEDSRPLSRLSTSALVDIILDIFRAANDGTKPSELQKPKTLSELRDLKWLLSSQYEKAKEQLLTDHRILRQWRRRENQSVKEASTLSTTD